jgi:hypothetical protein
MGGGDEIDIVAPNLLEFEHHLRQFLILTFLSFPLMGNRPVLTEDASKVAVREEDCPRPMLAYQRYFFAKVGMSAEGNHLHGSPAEPFFPFFPIDSTTAGAEVAILEEGIGLIYPSSQLSLFLQFLIGWDPLFFFFGEGERGRMGEE